MVPTHLYRQILSTVPQTTTMYYATRIRLGVVSYGFFFDGGCSDCLDFSEGSKVKVKGDKEKRIAEVVKVHGNGKRTVEFREPHPEPRVEKDLQRKRRSNQLTK